MNLKYLPLESQPREKLLLRGAQALSDAELLAIFLRTGVKGVNVVALSDQLISEFGSLKKLFNSNKEDFCQHKGLGEAKYVQLQAVLEMATRYFAEVISKGNALTRPEHVKMYLLSRLGKREREVFFVIYLDSQHQIISDDELFEGTINAANVYPREVVKKALYHNASAIIIAHNHPSGVTEPSFADKRVTERIKNALELVDIRLLDHFIIGEGEVVSFAEKGLL